jgi:hypothetical protein
MRALLYRCCLDLWRSFHQRLNDLQRLLSKNLQRPDEVVTNSRPLFPRNIRFPPRNKPLLEAQEHSCNAAISPMWQCRPNDSFVSFLQM